MYASHLQIILLAIVLGALLVWKYLVLLTINPVSDFYPRFFKLLKRTEIIPGFGVVLAKLWVK
jgi:hypothetical protein